MIRRIRQFAAALTAATALAAGAQDFPTKPIRLLVPTSTGTASDGTARFVADQLQKDLGVGVVVENRTGANGVLAVQQLMAAPADGYTLLLTASALYANPALYKNLAYDPVRDWRIIAPMNEVFFVLVGSPSFPANNVKELVEQAKAKPNTVTYASASVGSSTHLGPELFASRAGITIRHIPYKGGAQAIADVAGGQVDIAMTAVPTAVPLIKAGRLKALAVTGTRRSALLPDTPTLAESGIAGAELTSKQAIVAPVGTPDAVASKLTAAFTKITASPEYAKFMEAQGLEKESEPLDAYLKSGPQQLSRWTEMVRISGAKLD